MQHEMQEEQEYDFSNVQDSHNPAEMFLDLIEDILDYLAECTTKAALTEQELSKLTGQDSEKSISDHLVGFADYKEQVMSLAHEIVGQLGGNHTQEIEEEMPEEDTEEEYGDGGYMYRKGGRTRSFQEPAGTVPGRDKDGNMLLDDVTVMSGPRDPEVMYNKAYKEMKIAFPKLSDQALDEKVRQRLASLQNKNAHNSGIAAQNLQRQDNRSNLNLSKLPQQKTTMLDQKGTPGKAEVEAFNASGKIVSNPDALHPELVSALTQAAKKFKKSVPQVIEYVTEHYGITPQEIKPGHLKGFDNYGMSMRQKITDNKTLMNMGVDTNTPGKDAERGRTILAPQTRKKVIDIYSGKLGTDYKDGQWTPVGKNANGKVIEKMQLANGQFKTRVVQ